MVPGTAHSVADQQALGQRAAVVGTCRGNRQQIATTPHEQDGFVSDMPDQHLAISQPIQRDALAEVRAVRL